MKFHKGWKANQPSVQDFIDWGTVIDGTKRFPYIDLAVISFSFIVGVLLLIVI